MSEDFQNSQSRYKCAEQEGESMSPHDPVFLQPFPICLDYHYFLQDFHLNAILKKIENQKLSEKILAAFDIKELEGIYKWGFMAVKFQLYHQTEKSLQEEIRKLLNDFYIRFFTQLPQPKDEICNIILFSIIYLIHQSFYHIYTDFRDQFDLRFIYDCYHIVLYNINGIFVSDYYIKANIDKYFTNKFLNYEKEKKDKLKQKNQNQNSEKTFFGFSLHFPDLNERDGGNEFSKTLRETFKQKKKNPVQVHSEDLDLDLQVNSTNDRQQKRNSSIPAYIHNLQFNVNSVSPAMSQVLKIESNQLKNEKRKIISHKMEKINDKDAKVIKMLKELSEVRFRQKESKQTKIKGKNLIESHHLSMPGKEYFIKNQKVDPFFKSMLELQYVLQNQKESLSDLPSSKEVQNYLQEYNLNEANLGQNQKLTTSKQRIIQHLKKKEDEMKTKQLFAEAFFGKNSKDKVELNTEFCSNQTTTYDKKAFIQTFSVQKEQPLKRYAQPIKTNISKDQLEDNKRLKFKKTKDSEQQDRKQNDIKSIDSKGSDFKYKDNRNVYIQQFEQVADQISTESKINIILQNIQMRQNLVNRQLNKKIHKL